MDNLTNQIWKIKDKLYRFSLRITGNTAEAEDVVQEVYLKVWDKRHDMEEVRNPEAWCMTLTRNLSLDKIKSKHKRTDDISEAYSLSDQSINPGVKTEINDAMTRIKSMMNELPEKQKMVMHLRDIEQMSYEEIVEALDMPMNQVKVNLHRARTTIRERMLSAENYGL